MSERTALHTQAIAEAQERHEELAAQRHRLLDALTTYDPAAAESGESASELKERFDVVEAQLLRTREEGKGLVANHVYVLSLQARSVRLVLVRCLSADGASDGACKYCAGCTAQICSSQRGRQDHSNADKSSGFGRIVACLTITQHTSTACKHSACHLPNRKWHAVCALAGQHWPRGRIAPACSRHCSKALTSRRSARTWRSF